MPYLNVHEVSKILNVNEETIRRWIRSGKLLAEKHGGRIGYRIDKDVLDSFISQNRIWQISSDSSINTTNSSNINKSISINSEINALSSDINNNLINPSIGINVASGSIGSSIGGIIGSSIAAIAAVLSGATGCTLGVASSCTTSGTNSSSSNIHSSSTNTFTPCPINVDSLIKHIEMELDPLLNIDPNISNINYIELINNFSKLQSTLSSSLSKIEKAKLNLESTYLTKNITTSSNI